jgi:AAA+ ATPase superfamily predicted ATPase
MFLRFVNRKDELALLETRYNDPGFEFFAIYGRRRIGKTELIKHFIKNKPHIYLLCDKSGTERNAIRFKERLAQYLDDMPIETNDFEYIFTHLVKQINDEKIVIVFDEFSYLVEKDGSIPSMFQVIVDEVLKNTNVFLILCGSSVSMMEIGVLSNKSALYGRKTGHIKLAPLPFSSLSQFFPANKIEKNVEFYSVLGGVPFYLEKFSDKKSTFENIKDQIFDKSGRLYEEIDFLLKEELREPDVYKGILSAIASGKTRVVEIADRTGLKASDMDKYLKVLIRLGFVKKETSVTIIKSKKSIYTIDDNFFSFSFLFSEPFKSGLELGETSAAEQKLKNDINAFIGRKFEKLIREELLVRSGIIQVQKIGIWWGHYRDDITNKRNEMEIDIIALNDETSEILFGECKWKDDVDGEKLLKRLSEKAIHVLWPNDKKERKEYYILFAKSFKKKPDKKNVHCFDLQSPLFR